MRKGYLNSTSSFSPITVVLAWHPASQIIAVWASQLQLQFGSPRLLKV
jgi:hypothetical protein